MRICLYFRVSVAVLLVAMISSGCQLLSRFSEPTSATPCPAATFARDWEKHPAVIQRSEYTGSLYVMGDVHGSYEILTRVLRGAGIVSGKSRPEWIAGDAILVFAGDVINKGDGTLNVIEYIIELEITARKAGGQVVVVAGNHEIGFLANPHEGKFKPFGKEVRARQMSLCEDVYSPSSTIGAWLRNLPAAVKVNGVYISHTGWWTYRSINEIERDFKEVVTHGTWNTKFTCGRAGGVGEELGFFTARTWWGEDGDEFRKAQDGLDVSMIVFGHDPGAFRSRGEIAGYFANNEGEGLVKTDVGMVVGDSNGALMRCRTWTINGGCAAERFQLSDADSKSDSDGFEPVPMKSKPPKWRGEEPEREGC